MMRLLGLGITDSELPNTITLEGTIVEEEGEFCKTHNRHCVSHGFAEPKPPVEECCVNGSLNSVHKCIRKDGCGWGIDCDFSKCSVHSKDKSQEKIEEIVNELCVNMKCCKVCACENGKKIWCACHRKQFKEALNQMRK